MNPALVVVVCLLIIAFSIIVITFHCSSLVYNKLFGNREEKKEYLKYFSTYDFPELSSQRVTFQNNDGKTLCGYFYYYLKERPFKAVIVFCHGFNSGHANYMKEIEYFASLGYVVLGYDNTGTHESEGKNIKGFSQGILDLDAAINLVKSKAEFKQHKIIVIGHSWGGYNALNVFNLRHKVAGVIALSPFNSADEMIVKMTNSTGIMKKFVKMQNHFRFGKLGKESCENAIKRCNAPTLILHGKKDEISPFYDNFTPIQKAAEGNNLVEYEVYENKGHNVYNTTQAEQYLKKVFTAYYALGIKENKAGIEKATEFFSSVNFNIMTTQDMKVLETIDKFLRKITD